jgi:hypothetical protein
LLKTDRFDLNSINLSSLSVDALDQILTEGSFHIESEDDLFLRILVLGSEYGPLLWHIKMGFLSVAALVECFAFPPEWIWGGISDRFWVLELDSVIISDFPKIFAEFRGKQFPLLLRGGRDGFGARDFHDRCDGHANTLTLIEDTDGNIFGYGTGREEEQLLQGRSESEEFPFHAEESAQLPGAEVCAEGRTEERDNLL